MSREDQHAYLSHPQSAIPTSLHRKPRTGTRSALLLSVCLTILLLVQSLSAWSAPIVLAATTSLKPLHLPTGTQTFKQFLKEGQHSPVQPYHLTGKLPSPPGTQNDKQGKLLPSAEPPTTKPLSATLDAAFLHAAPGTPPLDLHSSDGRLALHLVPGLFDLSHASVAGSTGTGATGKGARLAPGAVRPVAARVASARHLPLEARRHRLSLARSSSPLLNSMAITSVSKSPWGNIPSRSPIATGIPSPASLCAPPMTLRYAYQQAVIDSFDLDPGRLFLDWPVAIMNAATHHQTDPAGMLPLHNDPQTSTLTTPLSELGPGPFYLLGLLLHNKSTR